MADTMPVTIRVTTLLDGGDSQWITLRPAVEGTVSLRSVPGKKPTHSELGLVGIVSLFPPSTNKPVASAKVQLVPGSGPVPALTLSHAVTAAEFAAPGDWRFEVFNGADEALTFDTEVTYPGPIQLDHRTATIDVEFLGSMLAEAVSDAGVSWHLESSANQERPRMGRDLPMGKSFGRQRQHQRFDPSSRRSPLAHDHRLETGLPLARYVDLARTDLRDHRLGRFPLREVPRLRPSDA